MSTPDPLGTPARGTRVDTTAASPIGTTASPRTPVHRAQNAAGTPAGDYFGGSASPQRLQFSPGSPRRLSSPRVHHTPDRFIPSAASISNFRMGAPAENLSAEERLLRRHVQSPEGRDRSNSPHRNARPTNATNRSRGNDSARGSAANSRITAGAIGVFGLGAGRSGPDTPPSRQRGREVNGNIFSNKKNPEKELESHALRLSAALGVDRSARVLNFTGDIGGRSRGLSSPSAPQSPADVIWANVVGEKNGDSSNKTAPKKVKIRTVPTTPFRVLDAPGLRDDYYCSLIAYSAMTHSLAVGLHSDVYSWNEVNGAQSFDHYSNSHVTSLAFSSSVGGNNILAIGRIDGSLSLWCPAERRPRLDQPHPAGIACVAWSPVITTHSEQATGDHSYTEDLLVGDEIGCVHYYTVDWGKYGHRKGLGPRDAVITLIRRISVHTQQICGLAWRQDGKQFATGGNDNAAFLFDTATVKGRRIMTGLDVPDLPEELQGGERYRWQHGAAVKAIAFCPWQKTLLATGGGSNDRCIHFFHTMSGAMLNTINVSAQVTSLLWSTSHREIAATLGYANPDHPVRIAVYSWPECQQVVQVPWQEDMRALYAVAYPGGPSTSEGTLLRAEQDDGEALTEADRLLDELRGKTNRSNNLKQSEGCIVVAASDETVRFHEVWSETTKGVLQWKGVLGGSDILEELEGIDREGREMIR